MFTTKRLPAGPDAIAPDGSEVRVLLSLSGGGLAHFTLQPGATSVAVRHRTVEEIWYVLSGRGQMWRRRGDHVGTEDLEPGDCVTIPLGTHFQFRAVGLGPLLAIGMTMPPWPGDGEAERCDGPWMPSVTPGPGLAEPEGRSGVGG